MEFLPKNYEAPVSEGNYFKFKKGTNTFRILSPAITGFEYWDKNNKPKRSVDGWEELPDDIRPGERIKHFWAFIVWNYEAKKAQIMEITQKTIQEALESLVNDESWGDIAKYDIVVKGTGDGLERTYTVMPKPHSEAPKVDISHISLNQLFKGDDPFAVSASETTPKPEDIPF